MPVPLRCEGCLRRLGAEHDAVRHKTLPLQQAWAHALNQKKAPAAKRTLAAHGTALAACPPVCDKIERVLVQNRVERECNCCYRLVLWRIYFLPRKYPEKEGGTEGACPWMDDVQIAGGTNACLDMLTRGPGSRPSDDESKPTTTTILENINPPKNNNNAKWRYKRDQRETENTCLEQSELVHQLGPAAAASSGAKIAARLHRPAWHLPERRFFC